MIKTGTTCFNDMYWYGEPIIEAVKEMGIRAMIGPLIIDFDKERGGLESFKKLYNNFKSKKFDTIQLAVAPHSVYGVSKENLIWAKNFAKKNSLILHIHLSETEEEVDECVKKYKVRPVEFLDKIGFLGRNCLLAHSIWLDDTEIKTLKRKECSVVYCPCSNMKLSSGFFPYKKLKKSEVNICLGTDGAASNNNLDLFEEMKFGTLLQKINERKPTIAPASEIFKIVTKNGAKSLKINAGEIKEEKLADLILVDLSQIQLKPGYNLISDITYSANGNCISDVICNGRILMRDRKIEEEEKIVKKTSALIKKLIK